MRLRFFLGLTAWVLAAVQCTDPLERYETGIYRLKPSQMPQGTSEFENTITADYTTFVLRRILYPPDAPLDAPGRQAFLSPQPEQGTVVVRDTGLNLLRIRIYEDTLQGRIVKLDDLPQDRVFVSRFQLFEPPVGDILEAHRRSKVCQEVLDRLDRRFQIPSRKEADDPWQARGVVYDAWQGWIDLVALPGIWKEASAFLSSLGLPDPHLGYESLFGSENAALYYFRAAQLLQGILGAEREIRDTLFGDWNDPSASAVGLTQGLRPYEEVLRELDRSIFSRSCNLKALIPQTPDSPQPVPEDAMRALARLWAMQSQRDHLAGQDQEAARSALGVLKMGWNWNQGPAAYRFLSSQIVAIGCESAARALHPGRPRSLYQSSYDDILLCSKFQNPGDFAALKSELESYEPLAMLGSSVVYDALERRAREAHRAIQIAYAQTQVLLVRAAVLRFHYDHKVFPERLEQLRPDYLSEIPVDPFSGQLIGYRASGDFPIIYSWGPDEKDNYGGLPYRPERGMNSEGDLFF